MLYQLKNLVCPSVLIILACAGCAKNEQQSFEGRIVQSCDNSEPVTNAEVEMYYMDKGPGAGFDGRSFTYTTTTDANGEFSFSFKEKGWDDIENGTYGAELSVEGKTVLQGITSSDDDLGEIPADYRHEVRVFATMSTENVTTNDTVYINGEHFRTGSFADVSDTISARLVNYATNESSLPILGETRSAEIHWQIRTAGGEYINSDETFALSDDCVAETSHNFVIRP